MVAEDKAIQAPAFLRDSHPAQQRKGVTTAREARARHSELLTGELEDAAVVEPFAVETAVQVGILVSCRDIDARVWVGVFDAPAAHVDPHLARASLDAQVLE